MTLTIYLRYIFRVSRRRLLLGKEKRVRKRRDTEGPVDMEQEENGRNEIEKEM